MPSFTYLEHIEDILDMIENVNFPQQEISYAVNRF